MSQSGFSLIQYQALKFKLFQRDLLNRNDYRNQMLFVFSVYRLLFSNSQSTIAEFNNRLQGQMMEQKSSDCSLMSKKIPDTLIYTKTFSNLKSQMMHCLFRRLRPSKNHSHFNDHSANQGNGNMNKASSATLDLCCEKPTIFKS